MPGMPETGRILPFPTNDLRLARSASPTVADSEGAVSALLAEANAYMATQSGEGGYFPIPGTGLHLVRSFDEVDNHYVYEPSLCITLQGGKQILIGEDTLNYGPMQCLIVGLDLPACGRIVTASRDEPFVGVTVEFDIAIMREVLEHFDMPAAAPEGRRRSTFIADIDGVLADCVLRMLKLTRTPHAIPVLYPSLMREFYYWLLSGPNAVDLCRQVLPDTHLGRIARAIHLLRRNYAQTLRVEHLAEAANMSPSSFHQHFKALTAMTPLQFQKQLRLLEARRLLIVEGVNVAEAACRVGYESASQFSREYSRAFGLPPKRDAMTFRTNPA